MFCTDLCLSSGCSNKYHIKTTNLCFSQFWRLGASKSRSRCQQISCLVKTFFLVCRALLSCCVFTPAVSLQGGEQALASLFCKDTNPINSALPTWPYLSLINFNGPTPNTTTDLCAIFCEDQTRGLEQLACNILTDHFQFAFHCRISKEFTTLHMGQCHPSLWYLLKQRFKCAE